MNKNPIRRAQLIAPFGVGALIVIQDGTSLISGGLDYWFFNEDGSDDSQTIDKNGFLVEEWRLQNLLDVDYFYLPPDYRDAKGELTNKKLKIPFLRFPQWHFCPICKQLTQQSLSARGRINCYDCKEKNKRSNLVQVPFVAMCARGHIQDFPWREWVHKSANPSCKKKLYLIATGGSTLGDQQVKCECGAKRSLSGITEARPEKTELNPSGTVTTLSNELDASGTPFFCQGKMPWLGTEETTECKYPIRGSLRSASNLYYADVRSAIYLPRGNQNIPSELVTLLEKPPFSSLFLFASNPGFDKKSINASWLRSQHPLLLKSFNDNQIQGALQIVFSPTSKKVNHSAPNDDEEMAFRREEFESLREPRQEDLLVIKDPGQEKYNQGFRNYFSRIMLINKLRETRVLAGFSRVLPENDMSLEERKAMLRKFDREDWLPAYIVYGEGIYLELNEALLKKWEIRQGVSQRVDPLVKKYQTLEQSKKTRSKPLGPRFILLHTLAHLIINRLTFQCGYSSAALRERLYVSNDHHAPMAGLLIYTAAGDSEGTMGGLVNMGKPENLVPIINQAIEEARWCSSDPICMEIGSHGGQGPESCNLAACHNCALLPETSCEVFNRFLDRAVVVGTAENKELGFFGQDQLLE